MTTDEQAQGIAHGADVSGDVDCVGHDEQANEAERHPAGTYLGNVGAESFPGDPADACRQHLNTDHQRGCQKQCPDQAEAELRSCLGIGGNPAGVVIRRARDEPRAQAVCQAVGVFIVRLQLLHAKTS